MAGSDNESDDASVHSEATIAQQQQNIQPQSITNCGCQNWQQLEKTGRDHDGRGYYSSPTTADHTLLFKRIKGNKNYLAFSLIPEDHEWLDSIIWMMQGISGMHVKARLMEKPESRNENVNLEARILPKLHRPSHSAFVSTTSASKKMSYADSPSYSSSTYTAPSNSKTGSHRSGNVIEDVLQSFVADTEPEQQLSYEDFDQIEKMDLEEMDLKWQMAMLFVRVHKFEQKAGRKVDFDKKESARFNKKKVRCYKCLQRGHFARECRAKGGNDKQRYSSFKIQEIGKKEEDSKALITGADTKEASTAGDAGEFALMGVTS
ncbi:ribonuclease H-like domain-containing protein, partial [Tanacetum coccineum]